MSGDFDMEDFYKKAEEKFGEKFSYAGIAASDESLKVFNERYSANVTHEQLDDYKQVWLLKNECPNCGLPLGGLLGSFVWGYVHGEGHCSGCKKVEFRLYHYIGECKKAVEAFSLSGF